MKFTLLMTTLPAAILANGLLCDTDGKCNAPDGRLAPSSDKNKYLFSVVSIYVRRCM